MGVHDLFTDADLAAIKAAASRAELRTAGEVVTFVVGRSDTYPEAPLRGGLIGLALALLGVVLWLRTAATWGHEGATWAALAALGGVFAGWGLVAAIPGFRRLLAGRANIDQQVARRAAEAFLEEEVFDTTGRTGILLFISHFEHRVVVLGDSGIHAKVRPEQWQEIAGDMALGIKRGEATDAVIRGIEACGALLESAGVARRDDDVDELANDVRLRDA